MPIIIKNIGVDVYGGFVLLSSLLGFVFGISSFGAGFRARRYMPSVSGLDAIQRLFFPQFLWGLLSITLFSLLLMILDPQINSYFFKGEITYSIYLIPVYLISYLLFSQGSDYFRYTSRLQYMILAGIAFPYLHTGIVILVLIHSGYLDINVLVFSRAASAFVIALIFFWVIIREIRLKFVIYTARELIEDVKIGFPLTLNFIVDFIIGGIDRYAISFYLSVTAVGHYNPGYLLGSLVIIIPKAMGTALPQLMSKAVDKGNQADAEQMLNYSVKIFLFVAIPYMFGSIVFGKSILALLANDEIAQNAYYVIPIISLGTIFCGINMFLSNVLFVQQKTSAILKINVLAAVFNMTANFILLYYFRSINVAAMTTVLSYLIVFVYIDNIVKRYWSIDYSIALIIKLIISSVIMIISIIVIKRIIGESNSVALLLFEFAFGVGIYFCGLFLLKAFSRSEISFLKSVVLRS